MHVLRSPKLYKGRSTFCTQRTYPPNCLATALYILYIDKASILCTLDKQFTCWIILHVLTYNHQILSVTADHSEVIDDRTGEAGVTVWHEGSLHLHSALQQQLIWEIRQLDVNSPLGKGHGVVEVMESVVDFPEDGSISWTTEALVASTKGHDGLWLFKTSSWRRLISIIKRSKWTERSHNQILYKAHFKISALCPEKNSWSVLYPQVTS